MTIIKMNTSAKAIQFSTTILTLNDA